MTTTSPLPPHSLVQIGSQIFSPQSRSSISAQFKEAVNPKLVHKQSHLWLLEKCPKLNQTWHRQRIQKMAFNLVLLLPWQPNVSMATTINKLKSATFQQGYLWKYECNWLRNNCTKLTCRVLCNKLLILHLITVCGIKGLISRFP